MYTETAIVLGLTQLFLPLMVLPLVSAMENIPDDVLEAAQQPRRQPAHHLSCESSCPCHLTAWYWARRWYSLAR